MTTEQKQNALYIGIDVHKDTHTAVGLSPFGEKIFEVTIGNYKSDFEMLEEKVASVSNDLSPYFGLEDCHGYGERLSAYLVEKGNFVIAVPAIIDRKSTRLNSSHSAKSRMPSSA